MYKCNYFFNNHRRGEFLHLNLPLPKKDSSELQRLDYTSDKPLQIKQKKGRRYIEYKREATTFPKERTIDVRHMQKT
jgi:hypothetical protein